MKKIVLVPFLLLCCNLFAQTDDASTYANHIKAEHLKKHLSIIASDEMEGQGFKRLPAVLPAL
jgi:hypothetical protein